MSLTQINKAGLDEIALDHVFTIGASGSSAYTFQGEGLNGTVNNPTLYLTRGKTYRFENGSGGHPIRIQSTSGASGTAYNTGVTNNAGSGTVIVEVQHDAPDVLYYQCTSHPAMNGILYITGALADGNVTTAKIANNAVTTAKIADEAVTLAKLPHGDGSSDGKFLRANNGADPSFETVSIPAGTTINNNADNRVITGSGTANTLEGESGLTFDGTSLKIGGDSGVTGTWGLEVYNTTGTNGTGVFAGTGGAEIKLQDTVSGETIRIAANGQASFYSQKENDPMVFFTKPTGGSDTERVRISGDVNVVIGLTNPLTKLHVYQNWVNNVGSIGVEGSSNALVGYGFRSNGTYKAALIYRDGTAGNYLDLGTYNGNYPILFRPNATEKVRIDSDGLKFNGDTAAANALDDYEEGTWSPGGHWTTISAEYIKIGRMVYAGFSLRADTTGSSNVEITGLPFTSGNAKSAQGGIAWGLCEFASTGNQITGFVDENTTTGKIIRGGQNLTFGSGSNNMNNSAFLRGTFIYYANA